MTGVTVADQDYIGFRLVNRKPKWIDDDPYASSFDPNRRLSIPGDLWFHTLFPSVSRTRHPLDNLAGNTVPTFLAKSIVSPLFLNRTPGIAGMCRA